MESTLQSSVVASLGPSTSALERMAAATRGDPQAASRAADEFEAVMLTAMLKPIFEGVETSEPFNGGQGEQMWKGLLVEEYAKEMVAAGGIGIADQVRAELLRIHEASIQ